MIYKVTENDIFEDNPELKGIPEFENCTSRQLKYVFLAFDYTGPYRRLKSEDRKRHAAIQAGYKTERDTQRPDMNARNVINGKNASIERAIKKFMEQQPDDDRETYESVKMLVSDIKKMCSQKDKTPSELEKAVKLAKDLPMLMKTLKELAEIMNVRDESSGASDAEKEQEISLSTLDEVNAQS